jgi:Na+/proline symporter
MLPVLFFTYLTVNWWSSWYPGAEPGGGGYVAQNIAACRDERHGRAAVLLFNVAHYAVRSWPWILTALAALVLLPDYVKGPDGKDDPEQHYVRVMNDVLPAGLRGLMLASFAAAFMSTQATQMNWGASYLINDVYRRFLSPGKSDRHYAIASRIAVVLTLVLACVVTKWIDQVADAWRYLMMLGAGTGLVYMLRWYWWRVNAWSEISAMLAAVAGSFVCMRLFKGPEALPYTLLTTTGLTTVVWLAVTFMTRPEPREHLREFYRQVRPAGPGWTAIARECGIHPVRGEILANAVNTVLGIVLIYSALFATGAVCLNELSDLTWYAPALLFSGGLLSWRLARGK